MDDFIHILNGCFGYFLLLLLQDYRINNDFGSSQYFKYCVYECYIHIKEPTIEHEIDSTKKRQEQQINEVWLSLNYKLVTKHMLPKGYNF